MRHDHLRSDHFQRDRMKVPKLEDKIRPTMAVAKGGKAVNTLTR